ncbi:rhomboid family intramembrane serine protease [Palleronia sediminis]|uniref:Rhomboid family intramembrane serine protease n=1 Tax=Palleronia sediminis TaxID=2547833 RepID=A0A4R6AFG5_9RHOB|nr:rhomboid family intramembrane serine protease [Palleronia sediminis]TDL81935.1 rhomboid family intramembrane serine protease [Palleronia sediminis]
MSLNPNVNPFNALPPVVIALAALIAVPEILFQLGNAGIVGGASGVGMRLSALNAFAFAPQVFDRMIALNVWPPREVLRLLSYAFVHLGAGHALFVLVFLLALGKMVAETFSQWATVAVFAGSAILGAATYGLLLDTPTALVGGYPAVYGLIGAYTFILWTGLGAIGESRLQAFRLIAVLMGIQLAFGLLFGTGLDWVADLAGFCAGFLLSFVVSPGGWSRVMEKLRQR